MEPNDTGMTTSATSSVARADALRKALESKDPDAYTALLAQDILFYSPVEAEPMRGKPVVSLLLGTVFSLFQDFRYTGQADGEGWHVLHFTARVGDTTLEGVDLVRFDAVGLVSEFKVLLRPLAALEHLHREIGARLGPPPAA